MVLVVLNLNAQTKAENNVKYADAIVIAEEYVVPMDFNSNLNKFIRTTNKEDKGNVLFCKNSGFESSAFPKTKILLPGSKYRITMYPVLEDVSILDCILFLSEEHTAVLAGVEETMILYSLKDKLPLNKCMLSFYKKELLNETKVSIPSIERFTDCGYWQFFAFNFNFWDRVQANETYLICFEKLN